MHTEYIPATTGPISADCGSFSRSEITFSAQPWIVKPLLQGTVLPATLDTFQVDFNAFSTNAGL